MVSCKVKSTQHKQVNSFASLSQALLTHGADIEAKKQAGATPLIIAAENGHVSIVEVGAPCCIDMSYDVPHLVPSEV